MASRYMNDDNDGSAQITEKELEALSQYVQTLDGADENMKLIATKFNLAIRQRQTKRKSSRVQRRKRSV